MDTQSEIGRIARRRGITTTVVELVSPIPKFDYFEGVSYVLIEFAVELGF